MVRSNTHNTSKQDGFVLVVALIFLLTLTVLGLAASGTTSMESLMARNFRDRDIAFASAEIALRDAESRINGWLTNPATPLDAYAFPDEGVTTCSNGICGVSAAQPVINYNFLDSSNSYAGSTALGTWTSSTNKASSISGLSQQPRHLIERLCVKYSGEKGDECLWVFRISVQATGKLSTTKVTLQETYNPG